MEYYEQIRWKGKIVSPFDAASKIYKISNHRYLYKNTHKIFTIKTGTIFHNTKILLRQWFMAIRLSTSRKKGISSCQLARDIGVTQKTAWKMLDKIRSVYFCENDFYLEGGVEIDETFVGGKNKNRHHDKKVKNSQGRSFKNKTPILGMLERGGKLVCRVVKNTSSEELTPHIRMVVSLTARIFTDEWGGYNEADKLYDRDFVDHGRKQYVKGDVHTNTVEGAWTLLKRSYMGTYHYMSRKHLQKYSNEFAFHYNTRNLIDEERFNLFLGNIGDYPTYKELAENNYEFDKKLVA